MHLLCGFFELTTWWCRAWDMDGRRRLILIMWIVKFLMILMSSRTKKEKSPDGHVRFIFLHTTPCVYLTNRVVGVAKILFAKACIIPVSIHTFSVKPFSYSAVLELDRKIREHEFPQVLGSEINSDPPTTASLMQRDIMFLSKEFRAYSVFISFLCLMSG